MIWALLGLLALLCAAGLAYDDRNRWRGRARRCARLLNDRATNLDLLGPARRVS